MKNEYWINVIADSIVENGIIATTQQIEQLAEDVKIAYENYDMAHGYDVINGNLQSNMREQIRELHEQLDTERNKKICSICKGKGIIITYGPYHSSESDCWKCKGNGFL